jgi:hypothetical protein
MREKRSRCAGMPVTMPESAVTITESPVTMRWNDRSRCGGMGGHDGPEYAPEPAKTLFAALGAPRATLYNHGLTSGLRRTTKSPLAGLLGTILGHASRPRPSRRPSTAGQAPSYQSSWADQGPASQPQLQPKPWPGVQDPSCHTPSVGPDHASSSALQP